MDIVYYTSSAANGRNGSGVNGWVGEEVGEGVMLQRRASSSLALSKVVVDDGAARGRDFEAIPLRAESELRRHRLTTVRKRGAVLDRAADIRARQIPSNTRFNPGTGDIPAAVLNMVARIKVSNRGDNGFPMRRALRVLSGEHFEQSYGILRSGSAMMRFFGDTRLFSEEMWRYLYLPGTPR